MSEHIYEDPTLADPDADTGAHYQWDREFQRHIVALLIADRQFMLQSLDLIRPAYFTDKAHAKVAALAMDYFQNYRLLPKKSFIIQELKDAFKGNKSLPAYLAETTVLFDYFQPGLDSRDYLRDKVLNFAKIQAVKHAFNKSLELIDKDPEAEKTWDAVYDHMRTAMTVSENFEIGLDYFKSLKDRYARMGEEAEKSERFILGLPGIDNEVGGGGWSRGEIISIVANSGVGKSVMLACLAATNILRGKRGVYITLEMSEDKVAQRLDAIFTGLPIQTLTTRQDEVFSKLERLDNVAYEGDIWPLVIKQFPAGTATTNTIRAFLSQLRFRGFAPDFVIVDYVGEMASHPDMKTYESRERLVRELRAMAIEENVFVATAMQPNRDFKKDNKGEHSRIDDQHLADAFGQIRPLDFCLSLNQNDTEKTLGVARAYVIKLRDGKSRFQVYLRFDKENLKITEIAQKEYLVILNAHKEFVSEETKIDMVVEAWKPVDEDPG